MAEHVPFFKALRTVPLSVQTFFDAAATLTTTFEEAATVILALVARHEREMFRPVLTEHVFGTAAITIETVVVVVAVVVAVGVAREVCCVETTVGVGANVLVVELVLLLVVVVSHGVYPSDEKYPGSHAMRRAI